MAEDLDVLLRGGMKPLWPAAFDGPRKSETARALRDRRPSRAGQHRGSDRYSLSLPGTIAQPHLATRSPVLNMTVAGDWTACGLDVGCVEAAVMSGMLAAHAITGSEPALESIIGYDHP